MSPQRNDAVTAPGRRLTAAGVGLILLVVVAAFLYGRGMAHRDVQERDAAIQQLQSQGQKLEADITDQNANLASLRAQLTSVQATLGSIMPSENTYNINPNQSLIVADGRLTIGLIGAPTNEGINININGKQQFVAAGDVIRVAPDPSTSCQVRIRSFDPFKALLTASCAAAKSQ
jgi:cell division protein FtsB